MRSLVPIPLIFLAAAVPGCAQDHLLPGTVLTKSCAETGDGQPFVVTKLIGSPSDVAREGCGGRCSRDPVRSPGSAARCEIASNHDPARG